MALQKRPPSADRQIERLVELAEWNADDALQQLVWAYQPDLTISERLAGEFILNPAWKIPWGMPEVFSQAAKKAFGRLQPTLP